MLLNKLAQKITGQKAVKIQERVSKQLSGLVPQLLDVAHPELRAFEVVVSSGSSTRLIHIVTDSVGPNSFYGGVGTAIALGVTLAKAMQADGLVLHTRNEKPVTDELAQFLVRSNLPKCDVRTNYLSQNGDSAMLLGANDLVISTSWWTTVAALKSLNPKQLVYLVQEDESMFYPSGDQSQRARQVLDAPGLKLVINSQLLKEHFELIGVGALLERSATFEPAMPMRLRPKDSKPRDERRRFLNKETPNKTRNIFELCIDALYHSFNAGILKPS